jgi:hypothetical protein
VKSPINRIRFATDLLCVFCFAVGIGLPFLGFVLGWQPDAGLGARPTRSAAESLPDPLPLRSFPARFEKHFSRHVGFRDLMVRWNNVVTVLWLATAPSTRIQHNTDRSDLPKSRGRFSRRKIPGRVVLGSDEWLFYFPPFTEESHRGIDPMDDHEIELWERHFEARRRQLSVRGIEYLLVIAPEKQSVYPSLLPWSMRLTAGKTRTDQLLEHLSGGSDVDVLDLRASLRAAVDDERMDHPVYHRTGTHWNEFGAFIAYREILLHLQPRFPSLVPSPLTAFDVHQRIGPTRGLASLLGIRGLLTEDYVDLTPHRPRVARSLEPTDRESPGKRVHGLGNWSGEAVSRATGRQELPRAAFLHDSFVATYLEPFLSEHFEWVEYHWKTNLSIASLVDHDLDVLIEVRSERFFDTHLPGARGRLVQRQSR